MFTQNSNPPGLIIAAPRSGSGKTTVTLGLLRALSRRGLAVQPFKCGPDYIDPAFHEAACGRPSFNLDSWAMRRETVRSLLGEADGADFVVAEALMGLFDGVASDGAWGNGASADLAALTGWPVVLVLDISGQSQSAAAVARGFAGFRERVKIAGVILNRVASPRHERLARDAMEKAGIPVFGAVFRRDGLALPERHLGLVQASEMEGLSSRLDELADVAEAALDLDSLTAAAASLAPDPAGRRSSSPIVPPGQRIALARDRAFSFVYPHVLRAWRAAGAEIAPFSPLADEAPDTAADIVWLPGGYPELYLGQLAGNAVFLEGVRAFATTKPVHGECGGYMMLGEAITGASGERHPALGLLGLETSFAQRRLHLGYRRAELLSDCAVGSKGSVVAGHEFHYASVVRAPDEPLFRICDADGNALSDSGSRRGYAAGSFFHFVDRVVP
jgi:cobyrinic acid a,c-diamide synthase